MTRQSAPWWNNVLPGTMILVLVGMVAVLLVSGAFYFRKMEQYYMDVV